MVGRWRQLSEEADNERVREEDGGEEDSGAVTDAGGGADVGVAEQRGQRCGAM